MDVDGHQEEDISSQQPLSPKARPPPVDTGLLESLSPRHQKRHSLASASEFPLSAAESLQPRSELRDTVPSRSLSSAQKRMSRPSRPALPASIMPSAPASPPTPAPSPGPFQRAPSWASAGENEDSFLKIIREHFPSMSDAERQRCLAEILNMCNSNQLSFVSAFVSPRLKKDPFDHLPDELCLKVSIFPFLIRDILTILGPWLHRRTTQLSKSLTSLPSLA